MIAKIRSNAPSGVLALCVATMLIAISTGMTFSISPLFLTKVLGISLYSVGIIEGLTEGLSQFCKLFAGISGDLFRRKKPTLIVGFILATISKPLFILANGQMLVIASKVMERISNGIMATPRDSYVATESPKKEVGTYLGLMMTMKTIGIAVGSITVTVLLTLSEDYRTLLWVGFLPCLLAIFICAVYVTESKEPEEKVQPTAKSKKNKSEANLSFKDIKKLPSEYWSILLIATLFMAARFTDGFVILRLEELGAPIQLSASAVGIFNLMSALCCIPAGKMSDKIGRVNILIVIFASLIAANLCLIFTSSLSVAVLGLLFWGVQRGPSQMLFAALISDIVPKKILGSALGFYYLLTGCIALASGFIAGTLAEHDGGLINAFIFGAFISTIALVALIAREIYNKPKFTEKFAN